MLKIAILLAATFLTSDVTDQQTATGLVAEINEIRTHPAAYAQNLEAERKYYVGNEIRRPGQINVATTEGIAALDEAIAVLKAQKPMPPLTTEPLLDVMAEDHVADQGPKGLVGHNSADGADFAARVIRHGIKTGAGEDISFGYDDPRSVALQLIIDDGVSSRGHRKNILDSRFKNIGTACGPHARYGHMCVIDFGM